MRRKPGRRALLRWLLCAGASCRCARRNTASGTPNWLASACASDRRWQHPLVRSSAPPRQASPDHIGPVRRTRRQSLHGHRPRRSVAEVALDGLPKRAVVKATPILSDFVDTYWDDSLARMESLDDQTELERLEDRHCPNIRRDARGGHSSRRHSPLAGRLRGHAGGAVQSHPAGPGSAARRMPRRYACGGRGSNPCRGMQRYWREPKERYLTPAEYRRIEGGLA